MASHGGARPGAGRKRKAEKYARPIAKAEKQIVDRLSGLLDNMLHLADGGYERITEKWEPAALVLVELPLLKPDGTPQLDASGKVIMAKQQVFPQAAPEDMVCVERSREIADNDRAANIYLIDRIMGKPTAHVEGELDTNVKLPPALQSTIEKLYGDGSGV